jgi:hypothetical protein
MAYKRTSNLRATPVVNGYTEIYEPPLTPNFSQTEVFEITQRFHRRPDLLAYELYGESKFWWIFTMYNRNTILDPINDFTIGKKILIPTRNFVAGI